MGKDFIWGQADVSKNNNQLSDDEKAYVKTLQTNKSLSSNTIANKVTNLQDKNGETGLHYATKTCQIDSAKQMILNGENAGAKDNSGKTALHHMAKANPHYNQLNKEYIAQLIEKCVDVNAKDNSGKTLLHYLCEEGNNIDLIYFLKEHEADVNIPDNTGKLPMHYAAKHKDTKYFEAVRDSSQILAKDHEGNTVLHIAAENHNRYAVKSIMRDINDIGVTNNKKQNVLHILASQHPHNVEYAKFLIENGGQMKSMIHAKDAYGNTPLHLAAKTVHAKDLVELLIKHGANITEKNNAGQTAIDIAKDSAKTGNNQWNQNLPIYTPLIE